MNISRDKHITNITIKNSEILDIRLLYSNNKKLSQWYQDTHADIIVNGSLFSNGKPIESFVQNGNVYSTSSWCNEGFGINFDKTVQFGQTNPYWLDFTSAFPMLAKNGQKYINFEVGSDLRGKQPRTAFSQTVDGIMITTADGRTQGRYGATIDEMSDIVRKYGAINSANLDGGGSTRVMVNGTTVNVPCEDRAVPIVLAIWLKKENEKMKVCIDAGHNNSRTDTGASGYGLREQDLSFSIGHKVAELLHRAGIEVIETRPVKETNLGWTLRGSLQKRCDISNSNNCDYFISIHCNAFNGKANGTEVYYTGHQTKAKLLADKIQLEICDNLKTLNRGVKKRQDLFVLNHTVAPAILVETAFIDNLHDNNLLKDKYNEFALAIANGFLTNIGKDKIKLEPQNIYSFDNTVEHMVTDGVIKKDNNLWANIASWEKMLNGVEPINKDYVRAIFDRYHNM